MKVFLKNGELFRVTWKHERRDPVRGGVTDCVISDVTDAVIGKGSAYCHWTDAFCKATGRELSFKRALANAPFSKDDRREMWEAFFNQISVMR